MSTTLVGMVTFGNLIFTKLSVETIMRTTTKLIDLFIVIGKPGDKETEEWLCSENIPYKVHDENYGFPYALNDIYDYWNVHDYDYLIIAGNDVVPYPYAIDSLIKVAEETEYSWISAKKYEVKSFLRDFPECQKYFSGEACIISDLSSGCWNKFTGYSEEISISPKSLSAIHDLALYKKSIFERIGYVDVNFYPAYYSDNDYARRGVNAGLEEMSCTLTNAIYFHFWSRTIHQGNNILLNAHHAYFRANAQFYDVKWGGEFGKESYKIPFGGKPLTLAPGIILEPVINIQSREQEKDIVRFWR